MGVRCRVRAVVWTEGALGWSDDGWGVLVVLVVVVGVLSLFKGRINKEMSR